MSSRDLRPKSRRGRCPRVLLVGQDRRYIAEARRRLCALGFEVTSTCRPSEIVDLVRRHGVNVAVVDGSDYLAAIVRSMAAIEAVGAPLGVVTVVDDSLLSPVSRPDVMPKWASLPRLDEHVELAFELRSVERGLAFA